MENAFIYFRFVAIVVFPDGPFFVSLSSKEKRKTVLGPDDDC